MGNLSIRDNLNKNGGFSPPKDADDVVVFTYMQYAMKDNNLELLETLLKSYNLELPYQKTLVLSAIAFNENAVQKFLDYGYPSSFTRRDLANLLDVDSSMFDKKIYNIQEIKEIMKDLNLIVDRDNYSTSKSDNGQKKDGVSM